MKNLKLKIIAAALLASCVALGYYFLSPASRSTENAYLNADVVNVAAEVSGRIVAVHVKDNQHVKKGDALFDIDPEPYAITLARAEADLAQALQSARQDSAEIGVAEAQIRQSESDLSNARRIDARDKQLVAQNFLSRQAEDDAKTRVAVMQAALEGARAKLLKARAAPESTERRGDMLKAEAAIRQARLDLARTHVVAAQDGQISNLALTQGSMVNSHAPLFALIADNSYHIDANFKESQLPGIHPGQRVDIRIDMYPDTLFTGSVESLSGGTGTAFSLLPAQNATGNWVKIAQRVPVRIAIAPTDRDHPLRIGATATVSVHLE